MAIQGQGSLCAISFFLFVRGRWWSILAIAGLIKRVEREILDLYFVLDIWITMIHTVPD